MRSRTTATTVLVIALFAIALSGCGQKGPLVPPKAGFFPTHLSAR